MTPNTFQNSIVLDDTQLWYVNDGQRAFPVFCTLVEYPAGSGHHRQIVEPALPAKGPEMEFLHQHLDAHRAGPAEPALWILTETGAEQVLHKAPGITPSYYYRGWDAAPSTSVEPEPQPQATGRAPGEPPTTDAEDFIDYLHSKTNLIPMKDLRFFWHVLSEAIVHWLYRRRRVLDLGCVRLVGMPYRKDWAACLSAANLRIRTLFNRKTNDRHSLLLQSEWHDHLQRPAIAAVNRHNNTCHWTIHAIETPSWTESVNIMEARVRAAVGTQWYGQRWTETVEKHEKAIFEAFEAYLDQTSLPSGRMAESSMGLTPILVPCRSGANCSSSHPILTLADDSVTFDINSTQVEALEAENEKLRALPALQFQAQNMRNPGKDLSPRNAQSP